MLSEAPLAPSEVTLALGHVARVKVEHEELLIADLCRIAEHVLHGFAPDYDVVEIKRTRHPDLVYVASRKGDTYMTHALFLGRAGFGRKARHVAHMQWGHYGLTRRTYAADLHGRT